MRVALGQVRRLDGGLAAWARQLGIASVQFNTPDLPEEDGAWTAEGLVGLRRRCEAAGLRLEALENLPLHSWDHVLTGGPRAGEQLERVREVVRRMGAAGIPVLGYSFMPTFVWRTDVAARGRGGAGVTAFDVDLVPEGNRITVPQVSPDVPITHEELWARYRQFLDAVLPVAEDAGVRLALHPDDPPVPAIGASARIMTSPEALERAMDAGRGSPAWAPDLCLGTVSSMPGGADAVSRAVERFTPLGVVEYVHVRDVHGTVPRFQECFLGEGNYDPLAVLTRLHDLGFDGFVLDDHVPAVSGDSPFGHIAHAHATGYLQATIAAVEARSEELVRG